RDEICHHHAAHGQRPGTALVHLANRRRDYPSPGPLCDDALATDGFRASGRQHSVQDRVGAWIGCWWRLLVRLAYQRTRAEAGMPGRAMRLSTLHPIFASVF
ncbi:MAG TPA: hypothetical protein VHX39_04005, partial [Acetobacteraceae bacterium]|nr:hypothetical protein [Acetobacteraceae bacterium]